MVYKVRLTALAERDAAAAFERIRDEAPHRAETWLLKLFEAIFSLSEMPRRCPVIPEAGALEREVRHLIYGKRSNVYRILFNIEESGEDPEVRVLRIWHGSRDRMGPENLEAP